MKNVKIKLLKLWEILQSSSDEDHPITTTQIIDKLKAEGIECDRRTLYADIEVLNAHGYEVLCTKGQHANLYCVVNRSFDTPELRILMDAVQAASFITEKKTAQLIDKISNLAGENRAELIKSNTIHFNITKHSNENIYYNIYELESAILSGKKVSFQYFDLDEHCKRKYRRDGERYTVNPIATVFSNDNYYLVSFHDNHENVTSYRVDRMIAVKVENEGVNEEKRPKNLDISKHRKQAFSMYTGESTWVRFEVNLDMLDVIFDKFGENTKFIHKGEGTVQFETEVQVSNLFFGWCCGFGQRIKIVSPKNIVEKFKTYINSIVDRYNS